MPEPRFGETAPDSNDVSYRACRPYKACPWCHKSLLRPGMQCVAVERLHSNVPSASECRTRVTDGRSIVASEVLHGPTARRRILQTNRRRKSAGCTLSVNSDFSSELRARMLSRTGDWRFPIRKRGVNEQYHFLALYSLSST